MAIIYTYPRLSGQLENNDLVLITDVSDNNKSKNATIQSINDLGPQGTVTDVILDMPTGFTVTPSRSDGVITLNVAGGSAELPTSSPLDSVQFNLNNELTGIRDFVFFVSNTSTNTLNIGRQIDASTGDFGAAGHINIFDRGRLSLWAAQGGGSNQAVSLTGPRTIATSNPGSYAISLPAEDPSLNDFPVPPGGPTLYAEPRVWVINGDDVGFREYDSQFMRLTDLGFSVSGSDTEIQYNDGGEFGSGNFFTTNKSNKVDITYELGLKGDGTRHGLLKLYCESANATHHVGIKGPEHTGGTPASYTIQLPNSLPAVTNQILESDASGKLSWIATPSGGGATPGGADTNVQFQNSSGDFDGNSQFTYNGAGSVTLGEVGANGGILTLIGEDQVDSGRLKIGHANVTNYLTLGLGDSNMSADYTIDFPVAAPSGNNKILESDSSGVLSWIDTPTAGSNLVIQDEGTAVANAATTINFTGGGVSAEQDPNDQNKVNVNVVPRRNDGFSPYPIYQGDSAITITGGAKTVRAFGCNAICDVQGGAMTVARIYGELQELLKFSIAVYKGELSDAANTKLVAFGTTQIGAATAGRKIHRLNLATTNVWVPEAGTPIVVVFEFVNSINQANNSLVLGSGTSGDADDLFGKDLAFEISGTTQVFDANNILENASVTDLVGYDSAEKTQLRVCHHFDPYAP